ncbi:uncharacterized protein LOC106171703 [Lingula anatina]|uniref:Uncharacterized protein LOC106171703 n=1 Tax=Lingula anatina TaxID=7574 RepID=A0A1S3JBA1_LINAN|nr:uncharacterized protein LOC106171703 [Lingula anatina]|eukprot:XP_013407603.1 uncharacterized protein LOC106171703 [Lingula anatina]
MHLRNEEPSSSMKISLAMVALLVVCSIHLAATDEGPRSRPLTVTHLLSSECNREAYMRSQMILTPNPPQSSVAYRNKLPNVNNRRDQFATFDVRFEKSPFPTRGELYVPVTLPIHLRSGQIPPVSCGLEAGQPRWLGPVRIRCRVSVSPLCNPATCGHRICLKVQLPGNIVRSWQRQQGVRTKPDDVQLSLECGRAVCPGLSFSGSAFLVVFGEPYEE